MEQHLCNHPDQDFVAYILKRIQQGFRIRVDSTHNFISTNKNMGSATLNPQVIEEYIKQELELGNIVGPFSKTLTPAVHINRFGVILKKHQPDKWRLITDLSFPEGASVNDLPYTGNSQRKKKFANFANLEVTVDVFLHFFQLDLHCSLLMSCVARPISTQALNKLEITV